MKRESIKQEELLNIYFQRQKAMHEKIETLEVQNMNLIYNKKNHSQQQVDDMQHGFKQSLHKKSLDFDDF